MSGRASPLALLAPVVGFVALVAVLPALLLFAAGWSELGGNGVSGALADPLNRQALENSLVQGSLSALAAVAAGYPLGVLIGRYRWRGREMVRSALLVPFLLPTLVMVSGVQALFGAGGVLSSPVPNLTYWSRGLPGIVLVNVLFNAPVVALLTAVGVESAPAGLEETLASLGAGPATVFRRAWGPPSLWAAVAGGLLTFLFSAQAFAAPLLLCGARCYTLEARIWSLSQLLLSPETAAVLASVFAALLLVPTAAFVLLAGRRAALGIGGRSTARPIPWRSASVYPLLGAAATLLGVLGLLLAAVLARAATAAAPGGVPGSAWTELFSPKLTTQLGVSTGQALGNSLLFAGAAAGMAVLLGVVTGAAARRGSRVLRGYLFLPLLISPVVLALALATFWRPLLGGEAQVWILILLAQSALALPFALQGIDVALRGLTGRLSEAAQSLGAPPFAAYLEAEVPAIRPALAAAALFAFALGMGEFTATYFLATPTFTTLPVELYDLQGIRDPGGASALAGLLVIVSLAVFWALQRGGARVAL
jgi:thiamine transport system permease protein